MGRITYVTQLQLTMAVVMAFGCVVLALHGYIARAFPSNAAEINPKVIAKAQRLAQCKERQHSRSSTGALRLPVPSCHELLEHKKPWQSQVIRGKSSQGHHHSTLMLTHETGPYGQKHAYDVCLAAAMRKRVFVASQAPDKAATALRLAAAATPWTPRGLTATTRQTGRFQTA